MRTVIAACLAVGLLACACEEEAPKDEVPPSVAQVTATSLDKRARPGRVFMYLDDAGNVVRTQNYEEIPAAKRAAVMIVEGRRRSRVRPKQGGGIHIEALPPLVAPGPAQPSDSDEGAQAAKAILAQNPPADGPPSSERWTDAQWRAEIKRELQELREEQGQEEGKEEEAR